jgi:hypothetical protein
VLCVYLLCVCLVFEFTYIIYFFVVGYSASFTSLNPGMVKGSRSSIVHPPSLPLHNLGNGKSNNLCQAFYSYHFFKRNLLLCCRLAIFPESS